MSVSNYYGPIVTTFKNDNGSDADVQNLVAQVETSPNRYLSSDYHFQYTKVLENASQSLINALSAGKLNFKGVITDVHADVGVGVQLPAVVPAVGDFWKIESFRSDFVNNDYGLVSWWNGSEYVYEQVRRGEWIIWGSNNTWTHMNGPPASVVASNGFSVTRTNSGYEIGIDSSVVELVANVDTAFTNLAALYVATVKHLVKIEAYLVALQDKLKLTDANGSLVSLSFTAAPFDPYTSAPSLADVRGSTSSFTSGFVLE